MSRIYTSVVTVGSISIYNVVADPNGVLAATRGSLAIESDAGNETIWQNTDGGTTWVRSSGGTEIFFDTYANILLESPSSAGLGKSTNGPYELRWNGSIWEAWYGSTFQVTPPPTAGWTAFNGGVATADAGGTRRLKLPAAAGVNFIGEHRALPSAAPWHAVFGFRVGPMAGEMGISLHDTVGGGFITFNSTINLQKYTAPATFNSNYATSSLGSSKRGVPWWFAFVDTGTFRQAYFSIDRSEWNLFGSATISNTDFITPDAIGWSGYINSTAAASDMELIDYTAGSGTTLPS